MESEKENILSEKYQIKKSENTETKKGVSWPTVLMMPYFYLLIFAIVSFLKDQENNSAFIIIAFGATIVYFIPLLIISIVLKTYKKIEKSDNLSPSQREAILFINKTSRASFNVGRFILLGLVLCLIYIGIIYYSLTMYRFMKPGESFPYSVLVYDFFFCFLLTCLLYKIFKSKKNEVKEEVTLSQGILRLAIFEFTPVGNLMGILFGVICVAIFVPFAFFLNYPKTGSFVIALILAGWGTFKFSYKKKKKRIYTADDIINGRHKNS